MKILSSLIATFAWALWFGGLVWIFFFVPALFKHDRALAVQAAPVIFRTFEHGQFCLAAISVIAAAIWLTQSRSPSLWAVLILLLLSTAGAVIEPLFISRKMEALRAAGQSGSPAFMKLHGYSMLVYVSQTAVMFLAGLLIFFGLAKRTS